MSAMESTRRGVRLGKYALVAEMARGGMGVVYLAQQTGRHGFRKLVVVKELKPELADDPKFVGMFLDEARLAARLNHKNIVQTLEVDQEDDRYFFVMEYLEGRTLHDVLRLKGDRALPKAAILRIVCDMLSGLHYAHELTDYDGKHLRIVHRDVSPRNVIVTYDGQVKLLDFGVAKAAGREQETQAGELKGRVPFMAPEHVSDTEIDRRADIFSTGVLVREALTGVRVWQGAAELDILRELLLGRIPPIPEDAELDDDARAILTKAMAPNAADRFQTAAEMRVELEKYIARIDPTGSFSSVGEHITREFADQRAAVRARIEEHVALAESTPPAAGADLPTLPIGASAASAAQDGTNPSNPSTTGPSSSAVVSLAQSAHTPTSRADTPASTSAVRPASVEPEPGPTVVAAAPRPQSSPEIKDISIPPPPPPSPVGRYVVGVLVFVAGVAGLVALLLSSNNPPKTPIVEPTASPVHEPTGRPAPRTPPSAPTEADPRVEVTVHAYPLIAEIWVDNAYVGQGPYTAKLEKGRHYFKASAPGYVPRIETLDVNATTSINLSLEREAGADKPEPPRRNVHATDGGN